MVTRKKKSTVIESADIAEMTNVPAKGWPKISQGTHLTVKTFKDGRTELVWDDDQLLKEVQDTIMQYELDQKKPAVQSKSVRKKKSA